MRFEATWGEGYVFEGTHEKTEEFFTEDNGYDPEEIETLRTLEVGETVDFSGPSVYHVVSRIE